MALKRAVIAHNQLGAALPCQIIDLACSHPLHRVRLSHMIIPQSTRILELKESRVRTRSASLLDSADSGASKRLTK